MNPETNKAEEAISMSTAVCTHIPSEPFHHVGQTMSCKLCGVSLVYTNLRPNSRIRMSKKERRKIKSQQIRHALAMALTEKKIVEEINVRR